jgi:hypothetical protein
VPGDAQVRGREPDTVAQVQEQHEHAQDVDAFTWLPSALPLT